MCAALHIFRGTGPALDLEDLHPGVNDLVHELDGTEILGGHNVFVVNVELRAGLQVRDLIAPSAELEAGSPVRGGSIGLQAEVTFAGNGHAEGSVGEHLDPDRPA